MGGDTNPEIKPRKRGTGSCRDLAAALCPSPVDDMTTCPGRHARAKSMAALTNTVARLKCPFHCNSPFTQAVEWKVPSPSLQGLASSFRNCPCQRTLRIHPGRKGNEGPETMNHAGFPVRIERGLVRFRGSHANVAVANDFTFKVNAAWRGVPIARNRRPVLSGIAHRGLTFSGNRSLSRDQVPFSWLRSVWSSLEGALPNFWTK